MSDDTKHSHVDSAELGKRTATRQVEQRHELDFEIKPQLMIMAAQCARIPHIEDKLNVSLSPRPVHWAVQGAIVVGMLALVAIAALLVRDALAAGAVPVTETAHQ